MRKIPPSRENTAASPKIVSGGELHVNEIEVYSDLKLKSTLTYYLLLNVIILQCHRSDNSSVQSLHTERATAQLKISQQINSSSQFWTVVFKPKCNIIKATNRLCIYKDYETEHGCSLSKEYPLITHVLNWVNLHSEIPDKKTVPDSTVSEFIMHSSVVVIAADKKSMDNVWFIKMIESDCIGDCNTTQLWPCHHRNITYIKGHFLERVSKSKFKQLFKISIKVTHLYNECCIFLIFFHHMILNCTP